MRIVSLFSGFGIFDAGLELAGVGHVVAQVEINPYARQVLARHWPDAVRFDDVRTVGAGILPECDVLCGGFPCTDLSFAGKRAGLDGAASGLWREYARIIREVRSRFVIVENVPGILAPVRADGRQIDEPAIVHVLGELSASGYDAIWLPVSAADVGAGHERDRAFVVGWRREVRADTNEIRWCRSGIAEHGDEQRASGCVADGRSERRRGEGAGRGAEGEKLTALANAYSAGSQERPRSRGILDGIAEPANGAQSDADGAGLEGRGLPGCERADKWIDRARGDENSRIPAGDAEPRLVRRIYGRSDRLVAGGFPLSEWRFAASAYAPQRPWESPRLAPRVKGDRSRDRIEGDGNAVTAQQGFVIGRVVVEIAAALDGAL